MLQCVAICCSVLQCVAVCYLYYLLAASALRSRVLPSPSLQNTVQCVDALQCVAVCCSVLPLLLTSRIIIRSRALPSPTLQNTKRRQANLFVGYYFVLLQVFDRKRAYEFNKLLYPQAFFFSFQDLRVPWEPGWVSQGS